MRRMIISRLLRIVSGVILRRRIKRIIVLIEGQDMVIVFVGVVLFALDIRP